MTKSHKIRLNPTKKQATFFRRSCGVARFAYNWALAKWSEDYNKGVKQSAYSLVKHLNSIKREQYPWMQEMGKTCSQYAIHNVERAFKKFFKKNAAYPKFKKKGVKDSFVSSEGKHQFKQEGFKIWVPRLGWVKCAENLRFNGKVNNVVIKRVADKWFAIVNVELTPKEAPIKSENQVAVGVDMGVKSMMVLSDGTVYENPKALYKHQAKLRRLHKSLSRKMGGSKNREKAKVALARQYYRVSCLRADAIHRATTDVVRRFDKIIIESLRPTGMVKNRNLAKAVSDASFGEIARQLKYKAAWAGKEVVCADTWYPSSKTCSGCGNKKDVLKLSERTYNCDSCGLSIDRDLNAAKNLAVYSPTPKDGGSEACGDGSSALNGCSLSVKHEVGISRAMGPAIKTL